MRHPDGCDRRGRGLDARPQIFDAAALWATDQHAGVAVLKFHLNGRALRAISTSLIPALGILL